MSRPQYNGQPIHLVDPAPFSGSWTVPVNPAVRLLPEEEDDVWAFMSLSLSTGNSCVQSFPFRITDRTGNPLSIRVQGLAVDWSLDSSGDLNRAPLPLRRRWNPVLFLRLTSGYDAWVEPFRRQMDALATVVRAVFRHMGLPPPPGLDALPETLTIRKSVYQPDGEPFPLPTFHWLGPDFIVRPWRRNNLMVGDLLDVAVYPEVVVLQGEDGLPRTSVYFSFTDVVRVKRRFEIDNDEMGPYQPPFIRRRNDYRSDGNIGHTIHVPVDDGDESPEEDVLLLVRDGNIDARSADEEEDEEEEEEEEDEEEEEEEEDSMSGEEVGEASSSKDSSGSSQDEGSGDSMGSEESGDAMSVGEYEDDGWLVRDDDDGDDECDDDDVGFE